MACNLVWRYAQFYFFRKGSGKVFSTSFCVFFLKKNVFMLYSITWPNFIVWLPLFLETLGNMCIAIVWFPGCDVISFVINLLSNKAVFYMTNKLRQKFKYLENKKSFSTNLYFMNYSRVAIILFSTGL